MPPSYRRKTGAFDFTGVNLNSPVDNIPPDKLGIATNVRPNQQGSLTARPALAAFLAPASAAIHSLKTFTSGLVAKHFSGAAATLYMENAPVDTGYSGNPLSWAAYQPTQAVNPFLYVADSARYSKMRIDGTRFNVGIAPPAGPPTSELIKPLYKMVSDFESTAGWTAGGTAGAPTSVSRISTTVASILFDTGTTGWACCAFAGTTTAWLTKGVEFTVDSEEVEVVEVYPQVTPTPTTIAAIAYDSGTSGPCCVVLASNTEQLERNSYLQLNTEYVRVLSAAVGEDNSVSFRCSTTGTHAVGETVTAFTCARIYFGTTHAAGASVTGHAVGTAVTLGTGLTTGVGTITKTASLDLSQINGRPITPEDWMHISIQVDNLANIQTVRVLLDVDATINDFAHNYFYAEVTQNLFQAASTAAQTVSASQQTAVQQSATQAQAFNLQEQALGGLGTAGISQIQQALALSEAQSLAFSQNFQLGTGASQWSEVFVPISSLLAGRVGSDTSRTLADVSTIRIEITVINGTANVAGDSWWIGGTYGPNAPASIYPDNPVKYHYRYRSTITGAVSSPGPLTRHGLFPEGQGVILTLPYSTDTQVDTIDVARSGGSVDGAPLYLGSVANVAGSGSATFADNFTDSGLGDALALDNNMPWPVQQFPIVGTCTVVGTSVYATSATMPLNLCAGTLVIINGITTVIRGAPSANAFQVEDNIDYGTALPFQINSPTTYGNPLPYLTGPYDETFFAAGDSVNPGRIYFSKRTAPDGAATSGFVDLTSSDEPILGVCVYSGYVVAMTGERFFAGSPTPGATSPYSFVDFKVGYGLLTPWSFTVGPMIFFWSRAGVMATDLGPAQNLTAQDMYPYLPHEGLPGVATNGYPPPALAGTPRLAYCKNGWLYVDFPI